MNEVSRLIRVATGGLIMVMPLFVAMPNDAQSILIRLALALLLFSSASEE